MKRLQKINSILFENKNIRHILFSMLVLVVFLIGMALNSGSLKSILPKGLAVYIFFLGCIYSGRWLCKKWFREKQKVIPLIFISILSTVILAGVCSIGTQFFFHPINFNLPEYFLISYILVVVLEFIGISITIIHTAFTQQLQNVRLSEQQKQSELNLLQSQLSPHFLFNTLNNLYGLSLKKEEKVPGLLLNLSELLSYSLYDTKNEFVLLSDEINYINNYIEFEKLRLGERLILSTNFIIPNNVTTRIAPMLLIVFIENAFKHSSNTTDKIIEIEIKMEINDDLIQFCVKNTCNELTASKNNISENSGLGLKNTNKRLELLYPGAYTLEQNKVANHYNVSLLLKVK